MGMILAGIVVAFAITIGAGSYFGTQQTISWQAYTTDSLRVGDPGHNLVGQDWTGDPRSGGSAADNG